MTYPQSAEPEAQAEQIRKTAQMSFDKTVARITSYLYVPNERVAIIEPYNFLQRKYFYELSF